MRDRLRWLIDPAVDIGDRPRDVGLASLRILLGLLWLYNVAWKRAPDFGEEADNGLYHFTAYAVSDPVLPPYSWVVENVVLPNITLFGYGVIVAETALAVLLLTGTAVRAAAALGVAQSAAIALSVAFAPNEWPWSYWLMIGAHVVLLVGTAGRTAAVDAVRAGLRRPGGLQRAWGVLALVVGAYSLVLSLDDPLASRGPGLRNTDISMSLGEFNLLGAARDAHRGRPRAAGLTRGRARRSGCRRHRRAGGRVAARPARLHRPTARWHADLGSDPALPGGRRPGPNP